MKGHLGLKWTMDLVHCRAFWHGWRHDVKRFCHVLSSSRVQWLISGSDPDCCKSMMTGKSFERLHFHLMGPHPRSCRGLVYIVTCIDPLGKWAEAFPVANKEAPTVAQVLVEQVICIFGHEVDGNSWLRSVNCLTLIRCAPLLIILVVMVQWKSHMQLWTCRSVG